MKIFRHLLIAAVAACALFAAPAMAAQINMCSSDVAGGVQGPRTIGGTLSPVPSGTIYVLNGQGCALIQLADVGYFQSQGFTQSSSQNSIVFNTGIATGTTNFVIGTLPAKAYIQQIVVSNSVAATAGTLSLGSTSGGTQIVTGTALGASADLVLPIGLPVSATGVATSLNLSSTAWNSSNVTITVIFGYY